MQLVNTIRSIWKNNLKHSNTYSQSLILLDHPLVKYSSLFNNEMFESGVLYCIISFSRNKKPTSQIYFEKKFDSRKLDWRVIYALPQKFTTSTYFKSFQYKILNNILYVNEKCFVFSHSTTLFYFFCNSFGKNITYLFCDCTITQCFWKKIWLKLKDIITLFPPTPQAVIFGFLKVDCQSYSIQNHILFIPNLYIYNYRKSKFLSSTCLLLKN